MIEEVAQHLARARNRSHWTTDDDLVFAHPRTGRYLPAYKITSRFNEAVRASGMVSAVHGRPCAP